MPDLPGALDALVTARDGASPWILAAAVTVGVALAAGPAWRGARIVVTAAHELGHAGAALMVGARVRGISLRWDTSGETEWTFAGNPGRIRTAWVAWWGYPAAPLAGAAGAWLLTHGYALAWAASLVCGAALTVMWARNAWGWFIGAAGAAVLVLALTAGPVPVAAVGAAASALLVVGGTRSCVEHIRSRKDHFSDSAVISKALWAPVVLVRMSFLVAALVSLAASAWVVVS